jgi:DNA-binding response OmpR family regulator
MGLDLSRLCVLIVDDNTHMRLIVTEILRSLGVGTIKAAADGADALKMMRVVEADIVIADIDMAPLDGLELTRLLRTSKDSPNPYVPIIMLTGHTEAFRVVEARDAGIDEFLAKPISVSSLYSRMRAVIERRRLYIRSKGYVGPDRRRRDTDFRKSGGTERRRDPKGGLDSALKDAPGQDQTA